MALTFSVIVPVLGEEDLVNRLVDHIRTVGYGRNPEIIIADGHPERTTLAALARPGILAVPAPRGRARQMNAGARHATGDVLVFLHADSSLPAGAFEAMERALAGGDTAGGAFDLGIRSKRWSLALIARVASLRSRMTRIPYGDQAIFLTREAFQALGGYQDMPILEEVDLMRRLKHAGMRIGFAKGRAVTSPRRWESEGVWRRTLANWAIIALYLLGVDPERLACLHRPARSTGEGAGRCKP
ncbi:TIGR04283 family arsenosugar biosynthesis glycosyltransferase [Fundidesulfovibrio terrae]|uniref:TIGR04283 family arsenosugar biosynthesis glycosyltransferase n=1 Tax=Fundidesulfovibrio terrae TaxID=2922866 RepID=UPI001FAF31FE|nr:TIGR04283 family arsenosugar biosynthesis glycosyltransferase [Fundidesulfovibrio terrae]